LRPRNAAFRGRNRRRIRAAKSAWKARFASENALPYTAATDRCGGRSWTEGSPGRASSNPVYVTSRPGLFIPARRDQPWPPRHVQNEHSKAPKEKGNSRSFVVALCALTSLRNCSLSNRLVALTTSSSPLLLHQQNPGSREIGFRSRPDRSEEIEKRNGVTERTLVSFADEVEVS
jgi:hypothetical protein